MLAGVTAAVAAAAAAAAASRRGQQQRRLPCMHVLRYLCVFRTCTAARWKSLARFCRSSLFCLRERPPADCSPPVLCCGACSLLSGHSGRCIRVRDGLLELLSPCSRPSGALWLLLCPMSLF